jgi:MraZ protein
MVSQEYILVGDRNTAESAVPLAGLFVSQYRHTLDPKRRITIPASWREVIGQPPQVFVLPSVTDPCVVVYPARMMADRIERIRRLSMADDKARRFLRTMASRSELLSWDVQGRIRVKDELLAHARIADEVMLVSHFDGFELWNPRLWEAAARKVTAQDLRKGSEQIGF